MAAYIFPGQGSQYPGMGKELYDRFPVAKELFEEGDRLLGFSISEIMFHGQDEQLKQTAVTQPSIFIHSCALATAAGEDFKPSMVAGHSLGEISALAASGSLSFEDGLLLVKKRADAMQKACEANPSTMAAILGLDDAEVEKVCNQVSGTVVPANYNAPGQVVISGTHEAVNEAIEQLKANGAKRAMPLNVGGAFHSPIMDSAREELAGALSDTNFKQPSCPVYQNATAKPATNPETIQRHLMEQLTAPVRWNQSVQAMIADGAETFLEVGPGTVLQNLVKKIDRHKTFKSLEV
jgi:[acyl-carrier-protein] S-malonyltransferase